MPTSQRPDLASTLDLDGLNPAQRQAVTGAAGPLLILAGPGSGKTRVIAHRIAWLVRDAGVPPWRILAVTFTNKAAREMRARVEALLPGGPGDAGTRGMALGTFHAVCAQILRRDGEAVGVPRGFVIYDDDDQMSIVKRTLGELAVDTRAHPARRVLGAISRAKNEGLAAETVRAHAGDYFQEIVARTFERYQAALHDNAAVDFDDLLGRTLELFATQPAIAQRYQERFEHVLVDEFQDTNIVQYRLARAWAAGYGSLTVVGDPDQSIYSWRAADIRNILHFERDFPDATTVRLEQNYRSTKAICRAADAVIDKAAERIHKALWTDNAEGDRPVVFEAYTEVEEADEVAREIESRVAAGDWRPGDVAVCYRTNAQSRVVEEAFLRRGIPYRLIGGTRFYARREIKDLLALCRLVLNPHDDVSFERMVNVPGRGVGQTTRARLLDWADRHDASLSQAALAAVRGGDASGDAASADGAPVVTARARAALQSFLAIAQGARERAADGTVGQVIDQLLRDTGYQDYLYRTYDDGEDRWNNVQELRTVAANYDALAPAPGDALPDAPSDAAATPASALATFLADVALVADVDSLEEGPNAVTLITLHAAKGLEFPAVFLIGMEEHILPHFRSFDDPAAIEEERRLCYVGMTRAQRWLYCCYAFRRALAGRAGHNPPSRYLTDLPPDAIDRRGRAGSSAPGPPSPDVRPARNRWLTWNEADSAPPSPRGRARPAAPRPRPDADRWDGVDPDPDAPPAPRRVREAPADDDVVPPPSPADAPLRPGERVTHRAFGAGVVVAVKPSGRGDSEITVAFDTSGIKKLLASLAPLERS